MGILMATDPRKMNRCTAAAYFIGIGCLGLFWAWYDERQDRRQLAESLFVVCERIGPALSLFADPPLHPLWRSFDADDKARISAACKAHHDELMGIAERKDKRPARPE